MSVRVGTLRKRLLAGAALTAAVLAGSAPVWAQEPDTTPRHHVVKRGDTLWDISHTYLGNAFLWPRVYDANRRLIKDPHWIYPGQVLTIVPGPPPDQEEAEARPEPQPVREAVRAAPEERLPVVNRDEFLAAPWIANPAALQAVAEMFDRVKVEGRADVLPQAAMLQDEIFLRRPGRGAIPAVGTQLLVIRVDRRVEPYGNIISPTAVVQVERGQGEMVVASIVKQYGSVLKGQRALVVPVFTPLSGEPAQPVERGVEGDLLAFVADQPLHPTADIGFVSIGRKQGIEVGDELLAYAPTRPSRAERGVQLPPEDVARLRVIKVSEQTATVRVLSMRQPSLQPGLRVRLIARIP